jgi:hypothetical protein
MVSNGDSVAATAYNVRLGLEEIPPANNFRITNHVYDFLGNVTKREYLYRVPTLLCVRILT